jgi:hypothetical protein
MIKILLKLKRFKCIHVFHSGIMEWPWLFRMLLMFLPVGVFTIACNTWTLTIACFILDCIRRCFTSRYCCHQKSTRMSNRKLDRYDRGSTFLWYVILPLSVRTTFILSENCKMWGVRALSYRHILSICNFIYLHTDSHIKCLVYTTDNVAEIYLEICFIS